MTEKTLFHHTDGFTGAVGDGAAPYTEEEMRLHHNALFAADEDDSGVLSGIGNELEVSGNGSPLSVNTGRAIVYGFPYWNTAAVSLTVATPTVGDTGGRVILRVNMTNANTPPNEDEGRVRIISNTDGVAAIPAMIQTTGVTWDIPLATFVIDTSGNIWSDSSKVTAGVSDARHFAVSPLAGMVKLREFVSVGGETSFTFEGIQQNLGHLLILGQASNEIALSNSWVTLRFNGDVGNNYQFSNWVSSSGGSANSSSLSANGIRIGGTGGSEAFRVDVPNYVNTALYKNAIYLAQEYIAADSAIHGGGRWNSFNAINSITIFIAAGSFRAGSKITLYGLR